MATRFRKTLSDMQRFESVLVNSQIVIWAATTSNVPANRFLRRCFDQPHLSGPVALLVHDRTSVHRDDGFGCRRAKAQSTVGSSVDVVFSPLLCQNLRLVQAVEDFPVEHFIHCPADDLQRKSSEKGGTGH